MSRWKLPVSWLWTTTNEIANIVGGGTPPSKDEANFTTDGIPWLTPADLTGYKETYISRGARDLTEQGLAKSSAKIVPRGSVLYTSRAPIGYCAIADQPIATNQGFKNLVMPDGVSPEFVRHYLLGSKGYAESLSSGTTFQELSATRMKTLEVPLAPLPEQRRIVAKIEALQERSRSARESLEAIKPLLETFRQSVLAAAFRGDLTADWRAQHTDVEPASELLSRIRAERRQRWEEAELAKYEAKGKKPPKDWKDKYKEPEQVDESELPELPEGWCWATIGQLALIDSGEAFKKKDYSESGIRLFQIANVSFGNALWDQKNFLPECFAESHGYLLLDNTNICIALNRPILNGRLKVARLNDEDLPAILYQRVGRIQTASHEITDYLFGFMRSPSMLRQVESNLKGSDQPYINTSDMPHILVPFAPAEEQAEMVRLCEATLSAVAGQLEAVTEAESQIDTLDRSILAKAFRGELVPQDPEDETASVLLERIRAQREAAAANGKGKKAPRRRTTSKK